MLEIKNYAQEDGKKIDIRNERKCAINLNKLENVVIKLV
jgi:hypothetical protein